MDWNEQPEGEQENEDEENDSAKILAKARGYIKVAPGTMGVSKSKNGHEPSRPRVFIVDDEPILLELAEKVLSGMECDIQTFTNPAIALETYASAATPPELIITDFAMHEMDGLDLIRECRRRNPKQKILLVSGTVDESIFSNSEAKPDRFLAKPYLPAALAGIVQELLGIDA